jgi:hypothetical protein
VRGAEQERDAIRLGGPEDGQLQRLNGDFAVASIRDDHQMLATVEHRRNLDARKKLAAEGLSPVMDVAAAPSRRRQLLLSEATVAGSGMLSRPPPTAGRWCRTSC